MKLVATRENASIIIKAVRNDYRVRYGEVEVPMGIISLAKVGDTATVAGKVARQLERMIPDIEDEIEAIEDSVRFLVRGIRLAILHESKSIKGRGVNHPSVQTYLRKRILEEL